jgi:hypothetical protein
MKYREYEKRRLPMSKHKCDRCGVNILDGEEHYIKVSFTKRYPLCPACWEDLNRYQRKLSEQFDRAGVFIKSQADKEDSKYGVDKRT